MKAASLQILWHAKEPVYSIDFHPTEANRFATCGGDKTVRLWRIVKRGTEIFPIKPVPTSTKTKDPQVIGFSDSPQTGNSSEEDNVPLTVEYIATLEGHVAPVNVVRYSPNGESLASAGDDGSIIIWKKSCDTVKPDGTPSNTDVPVNLAFGQMVDEFCLEKWRGMTVLRGSLADIFDMVWSPTGQFLITGSVDNTARVWSTSSGRCVAIINEHRHFIQGVAWDPLEKYIVTQSSDRTVKFHTFNYKTTTNTFTTKCFASHGRLSSAKQPEDNEDPDKTSLAYCWLYQSDTLASFFRRPCFTPDGGLVFTPAGIYKDPASDSTVFAVHIFPRNKLTSPPSVHLLGFPKPPIVIKCSPIIYELKPLSQLQNNVFSLPYRCVFAVATQDSVYIYDTQHLNPIAFTSNLHYASMTDISWSSDGTTILATSVDGLASIIKFNPEELGTVYSQPIPSALLVSTIDTSVNDSCSGDSTSNTQKLDKKLPLSESKSKSVTSLQPNQPPLPTTPKSKTPTIIEFIQNAVDTESQPKHQDDQDVTNSTSLKPPQVSPTPGSGTPAQKRRIVPTFISKLQ